MKTFYENTDYRIRGVCKLPPEVIYTKAMEGAEPHLTIWIGTSGKKATKQQLLEYVELAREWADVMEKIAEEIP